MSAEQTWASYEDRVLLMKVVLQAADVSNHVKPTPLAEKFSEMVAKEFTDQVVEEQSRGLPSLPYMQGLEDMATRMKGEMAFVDYVVTPLWRALTGMFPELQVATDQLSRNRAHFEVIASSATNQGTVPGTVPDSEPPAI